MHSSLQLLLTDGKYEARTLMFVFRNENIDFSKGEHYLRGGGDRGGEECPEREVIQGNHFTDMRVTG